MENTGSKGSTLLILVAVIGLALAVGGGAGYLAGVNLTAPWKDITRTPKLAENIEESTKSPTPKEASLDIREEAVPTPTPTFTPTPSPTLIPTQKPTPTQSGPTATPKPTEKPKEVSQGTPSLSLIVESTETGKVKLNWTLTGDLAAGFKTVYSKDPNPTYPEDTWHFLDNSRREDFFEGLTSGEKLHFRVCLYVGGETKCSAYSNDAELIVK